MVVYSNVKRAGFAVVVGRCNLRHAIPRTSSSGAPRGKFCRLPHAVSLVRRWLYINWPMHACLCVCMHDRDAERESNRKAETLRLRIRVRC